MNAETTRGRLLRGRRHALLRQRVDENDFWNNTSADCQEDAIQVIVNNSQGKEKEVNFRIINRGTCPVRIAVTAGRELGATDDDSQKIPGGAKERVFITVPAGYFLQATCTTPSKDGCNWTISDLKW